MQVALELENEDWFAIWSESMGQEVPKLYYNTVQIP
jgi:predicted oxidoreductase